MQEFKVYKILDKSVIKNNEVGGQPFIAVTEEGYLKVGTNGKEEVYIRVCKSLSDSGYIIKLCCNGIFYSYNGGEDWIQLG